jgi:peroxiredoxin
MDKKYSYSYLTFIIVISIIAYPFSSPSQQEVKQLNAVPFDFSLNSLDGKEICLKDYQGKKIVHLLFWSTWCPHCLLEMDKLKKLNQDIGNKPYEILAINVCLNESIKRIKKIQKQYQIQCKILLDEKGKMSKKCGVVSIPYHIVINKEGVITDQFRELPKDTTKYLKKLFPPLEIISK